MTFNCKKCGLFLGEVNKGKIRNGAVMLCSDCWSRADLAIQMADMAASQGKDALKGQNGEVVDKLMDMFNMR